MLDGGQFEESRPYKMLKIKTFLSITIERTSGGFVSITEK